jgi:hypothetical protein
LPARNYITESGNYEEIFRFNYKINAVEGNIKSLAQDVETAITNITEKLEGRKHTLILDCTWDIAFLKNYLNRNSKLRIEDGKGNNISQAILNGEYDDITINNSKFNSNNNKITLNPIQEQFTYTIALRPTTVDNLDYPNTQTFVVDKQHNLYDVGDTILIVQTDVPDRWFAGVWDGFYALESRKIDFTGKVDELSVGANGELKLDVTGDGEFANIRTRSFLTFSDGNSNSIFMSDEGIEIKGRPEYGVNIRGRATVNFDNVATEKDINDLKSKLFGSILAVEKQDYANVGMVGIDRANNYPIVNNQNAEIVKMNGNTVVWNQLTSNGAVSETKNGITFTNNGDGSWTVNGTASALSAKGDNKTWKGVLGHKYLILGSPSGGSSSTYFLTSTFGNTDRDYGEGSITEILSSNTSLQIGIYVASGATVENLVFRPQLFDLTLMFGAGNEPTTVAEFKALFPNSYYEYNTGELIHARPQGIKTVGFNACDGEMEEGGIASTGNPYNDFTRIRSKNFIKVIGGQTYTWSEENKGGWSNRYLREYDSEKKYIGVKGFGNYNHHYFSLQLSDNCRYVKLEYYNNANTTLLPNQVQNICFHLTHSGYRNGEYEEHWEETREFNFQKYFPNHYLRSAGTAYDEITPTKAIK